MSARKRAALGPAILRDGEKIGATVSLNFFFFFWSFVFPALSFPSREI